MKVEITLAGESRRVIERRARLLNGNREHEVVGRDIRPPCSSYTAYQCLGARVSDSLARVRFNSRAATVFGAGYTLFCSVQKAFSNLSIFMRL